MQYVSTRGEAPTLSFNEVLLAGLANDGGLYLPKKWPVMSEQEIRSLRGQSYSKIAFEIISRFTGDDIPADVLHKMISDAYATFRHPAVAPLKQLDENNWVLELFHGPTLAFKDVAMQLLSRLMDYVLTQSGRRATIVGATSGDTGGAAIDAFRGRDNLDIFILYPNGRVSPVQRRQMTTLPDLNVHALALEGSFDDCQNMLKAMFANAGFKEQVLLCGVNSINWARIMAQTVYYFTSAIALGAPDREVSYTVPSGNFGDIFAGYVAKKMGLPIDRLVIATNENDILARTLAHGRYEATGVNATNSPSMDIQISSNFERLVFEATDRDATAVVAMMASQKQSGSFSLPETALGAIRSEFDAGTTDEQQTLETIRQVMTESEYLLDPHSAVALNVARQHNKSGEPMITIATAHPAKFPDAVQKASGVWPELPAHMANLMDLKERVKILPNDQAAVENYVRSHSRAVTGNSK